jgi:ribosomal protein S18 acetylase RimI-like enzyme
LIIVFSKQQTTVVHEIIKCDKENTIKLNIEHITEKSTFWNSVNVLAKEAFPPEEYFAPSELVKMAQADNLDFLALLDGNTFVGFMVVQTYEDMAYLFFLAIDSESRSKGYGSRAIETLKAVYPDKTHTVDFEMIDDTAPNYEQRKKRRSFYLRNGYNETGLFLSYLGVDYEVFCMGNSFNCDTFKAMMKTIQVEGFNPRYFCK